MLKNILIITTSAVSLALPAYAQTSSRTEHDAANMADKTPGTCVTFGGDTCTTNCILKTKRPITVLGTSFATSGGDWVEANLFAFDRRTGSEVKRRTVQRQADSAQAIIDLPRGNYRIRLRQQNRIKTCIMNSVETF